MSTPDPWHLFVIEVGDADGTHAFVVSAQSGSEDKARELAEAAALDDERVGEGAIVCHARRLGEVDIDVFDYVGVLVE